MAADVPWMTISAVLLVESVDVDEYGDHVEFHINCLAMGAYGNSLPIDIYDTSSDPEKIESLRSQWCIGSLLAVKDCWAEVYGRTLRLSCPHVDAFIGDEATLREDFKRSKDGKVGSKGRPPGQCGYGVVGTIQKCVVMPTKNAGPMGIATIKTDAGPVEAVLFPAIFKECQSDILELGTFEFLGEFEQSADGPSIMGKLIVENILRL